MFIFTNNAVLYRSLNSIIHIVDGDNITHACTDRNTYCTTCCGRSQISIIMCSYAVLCIILIMVNIAPLQRSLSFAVILNDRNTSANRSTTYSAAQSSRIANRQQFINMVCIDSQTIVFACNIFYFRSSFCVSFYNRDSSCNAHPCVCASTNSNARSAGRNIMLVKRINSQLISINSLFVGAACNPSSNLPAHHIAVAGNTNANTTICRRSYRCRAHMAINFRIVVRTHANVSFLTNSASFIYIRTGNACFCRTLNRVNRNRTCACNSKFCRSCHAAGNNHVVNFVCAIRINYEAS